ncbi:N-acetyl-alpha-D-glucosaminyl L-malate synthase BshA [Acidiluteibacter ferrifornacis]|uniref:N-acetyl-alpha-D-glucosaminyl L-malate synthase BshA n=1 Tax=Acidiluteibacter ferrifornacis TaxID=2692424 RepID=A0A6N9NP58_9FLAO|nr:N-acetyl-alpha-D-glucosaminyl L-malate synthase BshA [Acidiluteibacter ferrifornacis]MBR9831240.1 N-acetyl-alpha-D-glucosaminyl L-malate synthase BshA [bacterium]NBG67060.1 N-acetyl-alpha-D-glucosaminyl L-malate synthase BshA [Acidiluteibacter ferrifornacis]
MNIGIVLYPTYGGSGVVGTELGKALADKGHKIHFITYRQPVKLEEFTANISYHEVRVSDYPLFDYPPYELVLASKLVDVVKYEKLDLLHVHYAIPHASAAYMAQQILKTEGIEIPFITTLHGTDITLVGKDASFEPVITFAINQSNGVTAVSESLKRETYEHFKIQNGIDVIPNFICIKQYEEVKIDHRLRESIAPNGERIIIHISNFRKVKRVTDVVKVFAQIRAKMPAKLVMVGDGPERNKIEQMCRTLGLCGDLQMMGKVNDTIRVLSVADLFILPSESESFGLAALEAMAAKTPVISTNTGGIPEVNIDDVTGYMSNIGDVDDMSANALKILKDDETLNRFKKDAFEQAKRFDLGKILPQYEALYERVLHRHLL